MRAKTLWVYVCPPVDFWDGWQRLSEYRSESWYEDADDGTEVILLGKKIERCGRLFIQCGWEGDVRSGHWMVSGLPDPDHSSPRLMFAVKQDNNGTTFIASEMELPWLREYLEVVEDAPEV